MPSTVLDSVLFRDSFGTPRMRAIFEDRALIARYVDVEVALARAEARCGVIPAAAAEDIAAKSNVDALDFDLLRDETEIVGYPILPLVRQLAKLAGESGRFVHWGATTQDIMDTAVVLQVRDALHVIESELNDLRAILVRLARKYRDTPMAGRTHLQHALPITFGYKVAVWLSMFDRHAERIAQMKPRVLVGQFAGAAGTLASLGDEGLAVQRTLMQGLGLGVPPATWHVARDGVAEVVNFLGLVTGSLGKVAYDVMLMASTEIAEVYEPFVKGRGASSTMPQKRNPISSERILAASKAVRQHAGLMLDAMIHDFERATGPWYAEWIALPDSFILSAGALAQAKSMLDGLIVDEDRMRANLGMSRGLIVAEAVMMALAPHIGRQDAHDVVYAACRTVNEEGGTFADVLAAAPAVSTHLDRNAINRLTNPANYLGSAPQMVDRIIEQSIVATPAEALQRSGQTPMHRAPSSRTPVVPVPERLPWYRKLGIQVLVSLALGIIVGFVFPPFAATLKILGDMFLALIKAGVAPLVFLTIVQGIASAGDIKSAGRIGWRSIVYFEVVSTIALLVGLVAGNLLEIGAGMSSVTPDAALPAAAKTPAAQGYVDFLLHVVPDNFVAAFAKGELLQVVVLAVVVGIGILAIPEVRREKINGGLDYVSEVLFSFINLVMKLAPIGTFGAVAYSVGSRGTAVLVALTQLVLSFYAVVALFVAVVLGVIATMSGFSLWRLLRFIKDELLIVLATASSESALPRLLIKLERLGCAKQTVGLVLPTGYAFNLDGTSLFMSMGVMFIAHAYGVPITLHQQMGILLLMLLTSKGAATVSGGSFVVFAATVTSTGILPAEGLAVIFGVYRFMSMAISTCNTIGNSVATVVVAKWSRTFDPIAAERHLYPERHPYTARADAALEEGNLLPEDMTEANPYPTTR